jgi:Ca2+-dependent lipid-binding protein
LNEVIFKSEVIRDDLNPTWDEAKIPIKKIRGAMMTVKVWDLDPKKSDYLGEVHMTWTELCSLPQGSKLKLHDEETDHKYDKTSGNLILLKWGLISISK